MLHGILHRENPTYTYWRCSEARFYNGFTAHHCSDAWFYNGFIHWGSEMSKHLCSRYMRSTECPSSLQLWSSSAFIHGMNQAKRCHLHNQGHIIVYRISILGPRATSRSDNAVLIIQSITRANSKGNSTHPCLAPVITVKHSPIAPFHLTELCPSS